MTVSDTSSGNTPTELKVRYIKSNFFRVVHSDGAFGGFTPQGNIFVGIYNERAPIPDVTYQAIEGGIVRKDIVEHRQDGKTEIIRELEVGLTMDINVAKSLLDWLKEKIEVFEKIKNSSVTEQSADKK